jgi:hypothetical protein
VASPTVTDSGMTDDTPVCCEDVMATKGNRDGCQVYECGGCGTVLAVDSNGRIYVIKET